jgi:hypothetical protein
MFYCADCGDRRGWPTWQHSASYGPCEICHDYSDCFDIPSAALPLPVETCQLCAKNQDPQECFKHQPGGCELFVLPQGALRLV